MKQIHCTLLASSLLLAGCGSPKTESAKSISQTISTPTVPIQQPSSDRDIELVRNGTLGSYNTTSVGKALEGTFVNGRWKKVVTPKGVTVVEFDGEISLAALSDAHFGKALVEHYGELRTICFKQSNLDEPNDGKPVSRIKDVLMAQNDPALQKVSQCIDEKSKTTLQPVVFQFSLSQDKTSFEMSYLDQDAFSDVPADKVLDFIYH